MSLSVLLVLYPPNGSTSRWPRLIQMALLVLTHEGEKCPQSASSAPEQSVPQELISYSDLEKTIDRKNSTAVKIEAHFSCRRNQSAT